MKRIIKLKESDLIRIVKKILNEQMPVMDMLSSIPETGQEVTGLVGVQSTPCEVNKTSSEMVLEIFKKSRGVQGQPSQTDKTVQNWISRISKSMEGVGITSDFTKVLSEIKTPQQLGAVLNGYNTKFKRTLYQDLSGEYTISWDTISKSLKKFESPLKIGWCKKFKNITQST